MENDLTADELAERLAFTEALVREVGRETLEGFGASRRIEKDSPDGYDIVTVYDEAAERRVREAVREAYGEPVLGEEEGASGPEAGRRLWVCDPIDGTFNFQRGLPFYGVVLACCEDYVPVCGAIYFPALGALYGAARGQGAFLRQGEQATRLHRSGDEAAPEKLVVEVAGNDYYALVAACEAESIPRRSLRNFYCTAATLAYLAAGPVDAAVFSSISVWDVVAGDVLLREAGAPPLEALDGTPFFPGVLRRWVEEGRTDKAFALAGAHPAALALARRLVEAL